MLNRIGSFICFVLIHLTSFSQGKSWDDTSFICSSNLVPILAYDPDNGLRYGGTINVFRIKKSDLRSNWRPFNDNIFIRGYHSTRGNFQSIFLVESNSLLPNSKCFLEIHAARDNAFEFYGVNGFESPFNPNFENTVHPEFKSERFYQHKKELYKFRFDVQRELGSPYLRLLHGISVVRTKIDYDSSQLITKHLEDKVISTIESTPNHIQINAGIVAEKRNNQFYCTKGYWHEAMIIYSTHLASSSFAKSVVTFRNYVPIMNDKTIWMSRISFQNILFGTAPYELSGIYYDSRLSTDGIGGMFNLRGVPRNRMVSNGFVSLNTELKRRILKRQIKKTEVLFEGSVFADHFIITQKIHLPEGIDPNFYQTNRLPHSSTIGIGGYLVLNKSGVVSVNYSLPLVNHFHGARLYIGAGFMF